MLWQTSLHSTSFFIATSVLDRKSTRLNSSHLVISYAVFCLTKKNVQQRRAAGAGGPTGKAQNRAQGDVGEVPSNRPTHGGNRSADSGARADQGDYAYHNKVN